MTALALSITSGHFPIKHGHSQIQHGHLPAKHGRFPAKHGRFQPGGCAPAGGISLDEWEGACLARGDVALGQMPPAEWWSLAPLGLAAILPVPEFARDNEDGAQSEDFAQIESAAQSEFAAPSEHFAQSEDGAGNGEAATRGGVASGAAATARRPDGRPSEVSAVPQLV